MTTTLLSFSIYTFLLYSRTLSSFSCFVSAPKRPMSASPLHLNVYDPLACIQMILCETSSECIRNIPALFCAGLWISGQSCRLTLALGIKLLLWGQPFLRLSPLIRSVGVQQGDHTSRTQNGTFVTMRPAVRPQCLSTMHPASKAVIFHH